MLLVDYHVLLICLKVIQGMMSLDTSDFVSRYSIKLRSLLLIDTMDFQVLSLAIKSILVRVYSFIPWNFLHKVLLWGNVQLLHRIPFQIIKFYQRLMQVYWVLMVNHAMIIATWWRTGCFICCLHHHNINPLFKHVSIKIHPHETNLLFLSCFIVVRAMWWY